MRFRCLLAVLLQIMISSPGWSEEPPLLLNEQSLAVMYSGTEKLHYAVSWSGGIKIGDLFMEIVADEEDGFKVIARVIDYGLLRAIYPVDDTFTTFVRPPLMLPYRYEVHQKEGRGKETRRLTLYDQEGLAVRYRKNEQPEKQFSVEGSVYNEFTGFLMTRVLRLADGDPLIIPTFVDEKRHMVKVGINARVEVPSLFGAVQTVELQPRMNFKGLYDKDGDTVIWVTDDLCRVPVLINSRILIGSLTATLVEYDNEACPAYHGKRLVEDPENGAGSP